jgi:hypothetical protein
MNLCPILDFILYISCQRPIIVKREVLDDAANPLLNDTASGSSGDELITDQGSSAANHVLLDGEVTTGNKQESGDVEGCESCVLFLFVFSLLTSPRPCQQH